LGSTTYERNKPYVLKVLVQRCGWIRASEREALYHDAYAVLLEKHRSGALNVEAMHPGQVRTYLVTAAIHAALCERRRAENRRTTPVEDPGSELLDEAALPDEQATASAEAADLRRLVEELSERRCAVFLSEIDAHQGTLRALRLSEHPPALRRSLRGRRGAPLQPEQVPSLLPAAFLKR